MCSDTSATLDRAIKNFNMIRFYQKLPWPFKQNGHGVWSHGRAGDILPGTVAEGASYSEWGSHPKLGCLSLNRSQSRSKLGRFRIHARDAEPESESEHFRIGAARTFYSEPEPQSQQILSRTLESDSEPELLKILNLVTAER